MGAGHKQHRHHAGQVVAVLDASNHGQWRDHTHSTAQITGTPTNAKERAQGKRHVHTTAQVS